MECRSQKCAAVPRLESNKEEEVIVIVQREIAERSSQDNAACIGFLKMSHYFLHCGVMMDELTMYESVLVRTDFKMRAFDSFSKKMLLCRPSNLKLLPCKEN